MILPAEGCAWGAFLPCLLLLWSPGQLCDSGHVFWALQRMSGGLGKPQSCSQTPSLGQGQHFSIQQGAEIFVLMEQGVPGLSSCGLELLMPKPLGCPESSLRAKLDKKLQEIPECHLAVGDWPHKHVGVCGVEGSMPVLFPTSFQLQFWCHCTRNVFISWFL